MKFNYLHLKKARWFNTQNIGANRVSSGRRQFIKTVGLGSLAWNPIVGSFKAALNNEISVKKYSNGFIVFRNGKKAWQFTESYFERGFTINKLELPDKFLFQINRLQLRGTHLRFSVEAELSKNGKLFLLSIPEFGFRQLLNFNDWTDGIAQAEGNANIHSKLLQLSESSRIELNGKYQLSLMPDWRFSLQNAQQTQCIFQPSKLICSKITIDPHFYEKPVFLKQGNPSATLIVLHNTSGWEAIICASNFSKGKFSTNNKEQANLYIASGKSKSQNKLLWFEGKSEQLFFEANTISQNKIPFSRIFYYAEYLNEGILKNYISASLPENSSWINNALGAFKLEQNQNAPDFEAFGNNNQFDELLLEPRLRAFKPHIENAISTGPEFVSPGKFSILNTLTSASGKKKNAELIVLGEDVLPQEQRKPVRKSTLNLPTTPQQDPQRTPQKVQVVPQKIEVQFDRLKFKPKNALSIKLLRPEDMLMLEFVFHNFNFTNKGQAPYLELDNRKNPGVIVIYFQSQHTLEEAYYEATSITDPEPDGAGNAVQLPAKHLRARKSRLVYELPANHEGFPLILDELLDWSKFNLRVHPRAWIKLPSLRGIQKPKRIQADNKMLIQPNKNLKFLDTSSPEFGARMAQNTKIRAQNLQVYDEIEVQKILAPEAATSIQPSFNTSLLKKISWKVEPIPDLSTSIEAPTLMYISPNQTNDFRHKINIDFRNVEDLSINKTKAIATELRVLDPLHTNKGEISELWHTRLGVKMKNGQTSVTALSHLKTIRALWADDADEDYKVAKQRNYPFMASLDANNRQKLVHTTSNYGAGFTPFPVPVNDLMLTTLGAYLDWHGFFDVPTPQDNYLNIIEWEHIATLGRDHYVKIVEEGYLFPFGHRAAVVKITERKFHQPTKAAVNRQRMYIVVLEKEVLYSRNDIDGKFIEFPFQAVKINTGKTPNIDDPQQSTLINVPSGATGSRGVRARSGGGANTTYNFYINVANAPFPFDIVATDKEGREHALRMPLAFMENRIARDASLMQQVINVYRGNAGNAFNKKYNETAFNGQEVAYAEFLVDGDTAFETEQVKFDAQVYPAKGEGDLKFHPKIKEAKVYVQQINELTGIREPVTIGLEDDKNEGEVFARVISDNKIDFSGGSDKSGGFLVPNMGVSGLSKLQGPVNGKLDDLKSLQFVPEEFFEAFEDLPVAKIFGVIDIFSLLFGDSDSPFDLSGAFTDMKNSVQSIRDEIDTLKNEILFLEEQAENAQQTVENQINALKQTIKNKVNELLQTLNDAVPRIPNLKAYVTEEAFYAEYKWQPQLGGQKIEVIPSLLNVNVNNPSNALSISTKFEKPFSADKPAAMNGLARFEKFGIDIVPLLAVNFNYLEFRTGSTEKTAVKVDIDPNNPIQFKGVLNFVNNLQNVIPSNGFSDSGPYMKLSPTGVTAGFNIAIPNVEVGICMISNISLGANVTLPFTGAPLTMGFNFCKRENPFMLTISCFGGGGYFMMVTTLHGIQSIEAAFEFGAAMSLNVGVASGGVSAMGGFYYKMEIIEGEKTTTLTGYLRLNGHLSILGLISLSLEFYLAFSAVIINDKVQKLEGVATLKVKVEVLFFSKTVSVTVRRELKGADADPKFIEMIDQDDWQEYCLAFAG